MSVQLEEQMKEREGKWGKGEEQERRGRRKEETAGRGEHQLNQPLK